MKKCYYCGVEQDDDNTFCTECGKEFSKGIVCPYCGNSMNEGDVFCTECGKKIDEVPQAVSTETTQQEVPIVEVTYKEKSVDDSLSDESIDCVEEEPKIWKEYKMPIFSVLFIIIFLGACWWYYNSSNSKTKGEINVQDSVTNTSASDEEPTEQKTSFLKDIIEFQNLMQGSMDLTNIAKRNYQRAKPSIEQIAKRNGFEIYEYHYVNGNLGKGEMSSYCCYLYKNCKISKGEYGDPIFTPTNRDAACVLTSGRITVYGRNSCEKLESEIKEKCGNKLYTDYNSMDEEQYYSDGKYRYYISSIDNSKELDVSIIDEKNC